MKKKPLFLLLVLVSILSFSQDGTLDTSFGVDGIVITDINNESDNGFVMSQQTDGKIVVAGRTVINDDAHLFVLRYNYDGSLDLSFANGGIVTFNFDNSYNTFKSILIQPDNKIMVASEISSTGDSDIIIIRLTPNGTLDNTFGVNGIAQIDFDNDFVEAIHFDSDGKIFISGGTNVNPGTGILFARLLPNGEIDNTFGTNGLVVIDLAEGSFRSTKSILLDDGSILISGYNNEANIYSFIIAKFTADGVLDESFGDQGIVESDTTDIFVSGTIATTDDGNILKAVRIGIYDEWISSYVSRLFSDGSLDMSFGNSGIAFLPSATIVPEEIHVQENGRILLLTNFEEFEAGRFALIRLYENGNIDPNFGSGEFPTETFQATDMFIQNDDKILALGYTWWFSGDEEIELVRYQNNPLSIPTNSLQTIKIYPNPSKSQFNIQLKTSEERPYQIADISGKIIQKGVLTGTETTIDLSNAQSGIYFLNACGQTMKLIKE